MALSDDLEPAPRRGCTIERLVDTINQADPGWARDFWQLFHDTDTTGASLSRAINNGLARFNLPGHIDTTTLNRCRRGDCKSGHAH